MHGAILVVDEPTAARLLARLLRGAGYQVTTVASPVAALALLDQRAYDLIIAEITLPEMDGFALARQIHRSSSTPLMFCSNRAGIEDKLSGFQAGADDFLSKPFDPRELLARVAVALRRAKQAGGESPLVTPHLTLDPIAHTVTLANSGRTVRLTPIETRLLHVLLSNPNKTLPRELLLKAVWGGEAGDDRRRLDVYIKRLRTKIEMTPGQPQVLRTIRGAGYRLDPGERQGSTFAANGAGTGEAG